MFNDCFVENFEIQDPVIKNIEYLLYDYIEMKPDVYSIQKLIDICNDNGGGVVIVPSGRWKSIPLKLKSNIELKLEKGCVIEFIDDLSAYLPVVFTRWEGMECYNYSPLIYANNCTNVAITGEGTFDGNGSFWWHWKKLQQRTANELCYAEFNRVDVKNRVYGTEKDALRPSFIQTINCKSVLIEGVTLINSPQWNIHPVYCEDIIVRNVKVISEGPNTDGLNPDSCKNVLIENCFFSTGDDCIAINSGMNEDGWRVNRPCENIIIRNCEMKEGHGAIVIGSGMSGGVKNVYVNNCKISGGMQGIRLKSMRGRGGYVDNVMFENISIDNVSDQAIQINMFYEFTTVEPKSQTPSSFKNIFIKNIRGVNKKDCEAIKIVGLPEHKLENIHLSDIRISAKYSLTCKNIKEIVLENVNIKTDNINAPEFENIDKLIFQNVNISSK